MASRSISTEVTPQETNHDANPADVRFELQRVDAQLRLELELIGQRMTWMSISHSFLFSAFTLDAVSDTNHAWNIRSVLRLAIPLIALTSAITVGLAILAAQAASKELRGERQELEHLHPNTARLVRTSLVRNGAPKSTWIIGIGDLPPRLMPWLLSAIWTVLLLYTIAK